MSLIRLAALLLSLLLLPLLAACSVTPAFTAPQPLAAVNCTAAAAGLVQHNSALAIVDTAGTVHLVNLATLTPTLTLNAPQPGRASAATVVFENDFVAVGQAPGPLTLWQLPPTGVPAPPPIVVDVTRLHAGFTGPLCGIAALTPVDDHSVLVHALRGSDYANADTSVRLQVFTAPRNTLWYGDETGRVTCARFTPDGQTLVTGALDGAAGTQAIDRAGLAAPASRYLPLTRTLAPDVRLQAALPVPLSPTTPNPLTYETTFRAGRARITALAPLDAHTVAFATAAGYVSAWDIHTPHPLWRTDVGIDPIAALIRHGPILYAADARAISALDAATGQLLATRPTPHPVIALIPVGDRLLAVDVTGRVWQLALQNAG